MTEGSKPTRRRLSAGRRQELRHIFELKNENPFSGTDIKLSDGTSYRIRILARGERAFYQEGSRALLLEISAAHGIIMKDTIRRWDDDHIVTHEERDLIIRRLGEYLTQRGDPSAYVVK